MHLWMEDDRICLLTSLVPSRIMHWSRRTREMEALEIPQCLRRLLLDRIEPRHPMVQARISQHCPRMTPVSLAICQQAEMVIVWSLTSFGMMEHYKSNAASLLHSQSLRASRWTWGLLMPSILIPWTRISSARYISRVKTRMTITI